MLPTLLKAFLYHQTKHPLYLWEKITVSRHILARLHRIVHLQICTLYLITLGHSIIYLSAALLIEYSLISIQQINSCFPFVKLLPVKSKYLLKNNSRIAFFFQLCMVDVGYEQHNHRKAVQAAPIGHVELLLQEILLHNYNYSMKSRYFRKPTIDEVGRYNPHMVALIRTITRLYSDVGIQRTRAVITVEHIVHLTYGGIQERTGCIDAQLDHWNHSGFDQFDLGKAWLRLEYLLQPLQSCPYSITLRQEPHTRKQRVIDSNVYITIFNGDSTCTAPEQSDWYVVVLQQKLYSLETNYSTFIELIRFLGDTVRHLEKLIPQTKVISLCNKGWGNSWSFEGEIGPDILQQISLRIIIKYLLFLRFLIPNLLSLTILQIFFHLHLNRSSLLVIIKVLMIPFVFLPNLAPLLIRIVLGFSLNPVLLQLFSFFKRTVTFIILCPSYLLLQLLFLNLLMVVTRLDFPHNLLVLRFVGLVRLHTRRFSVLSPSVHLFLRQNNFLLLGADFLFNPQMSQQPFFSYLFHLFLPLIVDQLIIGRYGLRGLFEPALKDSIAKFILLQQQQISYLLLQLFNSQLNTSLTQPILQLFTGVCTQQEKPQLMFLIQIFPIHTELFFTAFFLFKLTNDEPGINHTLSESQQNLLPQKSNEFNCKLFHTNAILQYFYNNLFIPFQLYCLLYRMRTIVFCSSHQQIVQFFWTLQESIIDTNVVQERVAVRHQHQRLPKTLNKLQRTLSTLPMTFLDSFHFYDFFTDARFRGCSYADSLACDSS